MPHRLFPIAFQGWHVGVTWFGSVVAIASGVWGAVTEPGSTAPALTGFAGVLLAVLPFVRIVQQERAAMRAHDKQLDLLRARLVEAEGRASDEVIQLRAQVAELQKRNDWLGGVVERHLKPQIRDNMRRIEGLEAAASASGSDVFPAYRPDPPPPPPPPSPPGPPP